MRLPIAQGFSVAPALHPPALSYLRGQWRGSILPEQRPTGAASLDARPALSKDSRKVQQVVFQHMLAEVAARHRFPQWRC